MNNSLILLHGALGSTKTLRPLHQALEAHFDLHTFDFIGHGSADAQAFDLPLLADQLRQYIQEKQLNQPSIFGYSMGGYVALTLGQTHSDLIGDIICLGTKFHWTTESAAKAISKIQADKILEKVPRFADYLISQHGDPDWRSMLQHTADMMEDLGKATPLTPGNVSTISNRVYLCLGDLENTVSHEETQEYEAAMPNASFHILPETPHPIEKVNASALAKTIMTFLGVE